MDPEEIDLASAPIVDVPEPGDVVFGIRGNRDGAPAAQFRLEQIVLPSSVVEQLDAQAALINAQSEQLLAQQQLITEVQAQIGSLLEGTGAAFSMDFSLDFSS